MRGERFARHDHQVLLRSDPVVTKYRHRLVTLGGNAHGVDRPQGDGHGVTGRDAGNLVEGCDFPRAINAAEMFARQRGQSVLRSRHNHGKVIVARDDARGRGRLDGFLRRRGYFGGRRGRRRCAACHGKQYRE
mgnify:CR=1 FL=1